MWQGDRDLQSTGWQQGQSHCELTHSSPKTLQNNARNLHKIVDKCTSCTAGSIAVTDAVFLAVAPNSNGSVPSIQWSGTSLLTLSKRDGNTEIDAVLAAPLDRTLKCHRWNRLWCHKQPQTNGSPAAEVHEKDQAADGDGPRELTIQAFPDREELHARPSSPRQPHHPRRLVVPSDVPGKPIPALGGRQVFKDDPLCPWYWKPCDWRKQGSPAKE